MGKDYRSIREVVDEVKQPTFSLDDAVEIAELAIRFSLNMRNIRKHGYAINDMDGLLRKMKPYKEVFKSIVAVYTDDLNMWCESQGLRGYKFKIPK